MVAAALLAILRGVGVDAVPLKPVQTGARRCRGRWRAPDLDTCLALAGMAVSPAEYDRLAPCRLGPACSPHLAARLARRPIRLTALAAACRAAARRHAAVIVEGAGGVGVPLSSRARMLDLMAALRLPVVLVARPGLGTLNHAWLTLEALRGRGLRVLGVVFNAARPGRRGLVERDNERTLARDAGVRVIGRLPFLAGLDAWPAERFLRAAARHLPPAWAWRDWMTST